jgi:hypothetical protein
MKKSRILAALATGTIVLSACSAGSTDYKKAAEKAFTDSLGKGSKAECDKPDSTDVGTTFKCVGTGPDGTTYNLVAEIDKKNHVTVSADDGSGTAPADTTADDSSTETTEG